MLCDVRQSTNCLKMSSGEMLVCEMVAFGEEKEGKADHLSFYREIYMYVHVHVYTVGY